MDWTDYFDRKKFVNYSQTLIDEIIQSIHTEKISIHTQNKLTVDELTFLYGWPIYFSVNIFIERLLRSIYNIKINSSILYDPVKYIPEYYSQVGGAASAYYHGIEINQKLMYDINFLINNESIGKKIEIDEIPQCDNDVILKIKREYNLRSGIRFLKRITIGFFDSLRRILFQSEIVYLREKWFSNIYSNYNIFQEMVYNNYKPDSILRGKIRECCKTVFDNNMHNYVDELNQENRDHLSDLFSSWVDHAIPLSLIEGLGDRFNYYRKTLFGWSVKQIHSGLGHYYNDNFKVFSVLAKRKKAILIAHDHGVGNFACYFPLQANLPNFYKGITGIMFMDYYCDWGKDKVSDKWDGVEAKLNIKIINTGSVYLSSMSKWQGKAICEDKITLLYPSGPLRDFMANLEEVTPEKNFLQRKKVLNFLHTLMQSFSGLEVMYKPFPGIDSRNDPFMEVFSLELKKGRAKVTNTRPIELMPEVDIVLFDMISTGFAEAVQIGVPTLVYNNKSDYQSASDEGKKVNDQFENCGMVFYDAKSGTKSFEKVVNDLNAFQRASREPIRRFQDAVAYPVSKSKYLNKINLMIN